MRTGTSAKYRSESSDSSYSEGEYEDEKNDDYGSVSQRNNTNDRDTQDLYVLALGDEDIVDRVTNLLTGKSTGRRIKRVIFKYGLYQTVLGFMLVVISSYADVNFRFLESFNLPLHGAPVLTLMWLVSFPTFFMGLLSLLAVYYWASLCTNRQLFTSLLRIYFGILALLFIFTLWLICALFLTFKNADFKTNPDMIAVYPSYVVTIICVLPYLPSLVYYLMDVHYLNDEIKANGAITEPNPPKGTKDLSGFSISHVCGLLFAIPFLIFFQLADMLGALYRVLERCAASRRRVLLAKQVEKENGKTKKKKGLCYRILKTLKKLFFCCCFCCSNMGSKFMVRGSRNGRGGGRRVQPSGGDDDVEQQLEADHARERIEQKEKERLEAIEQRKHESELKQLQSKEIEELRRQEQLAKIEDARERDIEDRRLESEFQERKKKQLEEEAMQQKIDAEKKRKKEKKEADALAALLVKQEQDKQNEIDKEKAKKLEFHPILTIPLFKSTWSALSTAGSFQCKLKLTPEVSIIVAHLKKQGFHVVFSNTTGTEASPLGLESEVGFCNIRSPQKREALFMGKFTIKQKFFQADMKCEDSNEVPLYVKKFALAKVLKIDTST